MAKPAPVLVAVLALASIATAQFQTRPTTQLSPNNIPVNTHGWFSWLLAAPKQAVAGNTQNNTVHTARLAHLCYMDVDANGDAIYVYRRSVDGGATWSAPRTLFTVLSTEATRAAATRLVCFQHTVWLVISSTRNNTNGGESIYAFGSEDQGQTWQGPLLLSTGVNAATNTLADCEDPQAASAGLLHVAFEADTVASTNEDIYYTSAGFVSGTFQIITTETRINSATAVGTVDCDFPSLAASATLVNVAWQDDRNQPGVTGANNAFSKTSLALGADFASLNEVSHTNFAAALGWDPRRSRSAAAFPNVYVLMEDPRNGTHDEVYLEISRDAGRTWLTANVNLSPAGIDSDQTALAADGNRVVVAYLDDRNGTGNVNNNAFVVVDQNAGADFLAGTHTEHQLSTTDSELHEIDIAGDIIAVALEDCGFPEDTALGYSVDGGRTFVSTPITRGGLCRRNRRDVDEPNLCVTLNRDIPMVWISEPVSGSNNLNKIFVGGTKVPVLQNLTAQNQGLQLTEASPSDSGQLALVLLSATGTSWVALDEAIGFGVNLTPDGLTLGVLGNLAPFLAVIDPQGNASFPGIPDVGALIGINVWGAAVTYDTTAGRWMAATDPFRF